MRHFLLALAPAGPAVGHPIGVAAAAVAGPLVSAAGLADLAAIRRRRARRRTVPAPPVASPAQQEIPAA
jgi:hypothetical protein